MGRAVQVEFLRAGFTDNSGQPLASGKVYTYEAGTTTDKATYTEQDESVEAANPVILDSNGRAAIFAEGAYKFVIKDSNDVTLYTWDDLQFIYPDDLAIYAGTSTGSSNTYAVTPSPAVTSYTDGLLITFIANHASSGAATLNVSGLGAKSFVKADGTTAITTGDITSGMIVNAQYISADNHFRLINQSGVVPVSGGGTGSATAAGARTNLGLVIATDVQAYSSHLAAIVALSKTDGNFIVANGTTFVAESGATAITSLSALLAAIAAMTPTDGIFIVGNGTTFVAESGYTARTSMGAAASGSNSDITALTGIANSTFTPSVVPDGSMTFTSGTTRQGRYVRIGPFIFFDLCIIGTLGGTASAGMLVDAPVAGIADASHCTWSCAADNGDGTKINDMRWRYTGSGLYVFQGGLANFALGSSFQLSIQGHYKA